MRAYPTVVLTRVAPASSSLPVFLSLALSFSSWVQVACPRLSIDWGYAFHTPLLSSYEAEVALGESTWLDVYPMDYYSDAGGKWSNYAAGNKQKVETKGVKGVNPIKARKEARLAAAAAAQAAQAAGTPKVEIAYASEE